MKLFLLLAVASFVPSTITAGKIFSKLSISTKSPSSLHINQKSDNAPTYKVTIKKGYDSANQIDGLFNKLPNTKVINVFKTNQNNTLVTVQTLDVKKIRKKQWCKAIKKTH